MHLDFLSSEQRARGRYYRWLIRNAMLVMGIAGLLLAVGEWLLPTAGGAIYWLKLALAGITGLAIITMLELCRRAGREGLPLSILHRD